MCSHAKLEEIGELIESDNYALAKVRISEARAAGQTEALLSLFEAICVYEEGDDVETLRLIVKFLANPGRSKKRSYALFTAAVCLENLGLNEQALELLGEVPSSYPDREEARARIAKELTRQKRALWFFSAIKSGSR